MKTIEGESMSEKGNSWAWPVALMVVATVVVAGVVIVVCGVAGFIWHLFPSDVTHEFVMHVQSTSPCAELVVARVTTEVANKAEIVGTILPTTTVQAKAPVEYNYYVDMKGKWSLILEQGVLHVAAPPLQLMAPSVDTGKIETFSSGNYWHPVKTYKESENLRGSLFQKAKENGMSPDALALATPVAMKGLEDFILGWWRDNQRRSELKSISISFGGAPATQLPARL